MLEFRTIYNTMNGTGIFIEFKPTTPANPMPGCYSDIGGYLKYTESNFDRMWALILTLYARGPTLASVVYDRYPEYSGTWSLCNIRGIYIRPPA